VGAVEFELYENADPTQQWVYTVLVEPLQDTGLMAVGVNVERLDGGKPVQYTLICWVIDSELEDEAEAAEQAEDDAAAAAEDAAPAGGGGSGNG